jgi:iron complex transport system ATP-binding protein
MKTNPHEILSVNSLKIGYNAGREENVLLPPLNASAHKGELVAVIGKNGVGKSTLLRTITGLQPSLGGKIFYSGKNIMTYSRMQLAREVGYISTEIVRVSNMRVYDLVSLGRFPHTDWTGKIDFENKNAILNALDNTSMSGYSNRFVSELSDGERQRAMIARLLAQDTGLMVMDEPTAFLDIGNKYEILNLLSRLAHTNEKTIIFSTHDLHMALNHSDKIWLILDDRLIEGAPEDLMIAGAFEHLFDSSHVEFNSEDGTFSFRSLEKGSIYLEGEGIKKHWTKKAINRAGFSVSAEKTIPYITVPDSKKCEYLLTSGKSVRQFESVYDLVRFLTKEDLHSI